MALASRLLWLTLLLAWPASALAGSCSQDGDCPGTQLCMSGRCARADCSSDAQCPQGRMCRNGGCRLRECHRDEDCNIERRCLEGICGMPTPTSRIEAPAAASDGATTVEISLGPQFPVGVLAEAAFDVAADARLALGIGSTLDAGGVGWRAAWRQGAGNVGPLQLDVFALLTGMRVGKAGAAGPGAMLLGSGRGLFDLGRTVTPVFWGAGLGLGLPHGTRRRRIVRLELGALLLLHDRYPANADFAALPCVGLRYGVAF